MKRRATRSRQITIRSIAVALVVAIIAASGWYMLPTIAGWLDQSVSTHPVVAMDDVNLRSGPGLDYEVISVVPRGSELRAERESTNGFSAVSVNGRDGWISTDYLALPGTAYAGEYEVSQSEPVQPAPVASEPVYPESVDIPTKPPVVVPTAEPTVAPTVAPAMEPVIAQSTQVEDEPQPGEHWIEVDRTNRTVTLHNGEIIVARFDALIGKDLSPDGYYSTAVGTHYVHVKEKSLVETPFADGVYLTDFVGFDAKRSNGFHSPTRDEFGNVVVTGGTQTLGCVRLAEEDAVMLFDFAYIGMRVEVHD